MAHSTEWCEVCEKWATKGHSEKKHAKNYLKNRTALGRFGKMEEITGIVVFLSSDMASFFHSTIIHADGGQSKHYMSDS